MWRFIGDWIIKGMPVPESFLSEEADLALQDLDDERALPSEFFIQRDRDSAWCDEDFWEAGFVVGADGWPTWIVSARKEIMEGGKARGLLRSMPSEQGDEEHWASLSDLLKPDTEDIELTLTDYITPVCKRAQKLLGKVLEWDCGLSEHLNAIDGLSLMRAHDVMESWADHLFLQMRNGKAWADFHLLTHSIRDFIESHHAEWMNPQAVRVRTARRSKATLSDIRVDYMASLQLGLLTRIGTIPIVPGVHSHYYGSAVGQLHIHAASNAGTQGRPERTLSTPRRAYPRSPCTVSASTSWPVVVAIVREPQVIVNQ